MSIKIKEIAEQDKAWVLEVFLTWGAEFVVTRGRKVFASDVEGFYAEDVNGLKVGLLTYEMIGDQCEVVTLDSFTKFSGIGTMLMDRVKQKAVTLGCKRLWLITTNDNLDAIRFYQRRGFTIAAIHVNSLENSRRIKPSIPLVGQFGIPLRDEVEFEMIL